MTFPLAMRSKRPRLVGSVSKNVATVSLAPGGLGSGEVFSCKRSNSPSKLSIC